MSKAVHGKVVDDETRCNHYQSALDVIAIKFKCCQQYYSCHICHEESAGHSVEVWNPKEFDEKAILCGVCKEELTITQYLNSNNSCPKCNALFNPNCEKHHSLYFEMK